MNVDLGQLFRNIDSRIASNPGSTSQSLAQELDVTMGAIERAVREVNGVSFREYRENKRLARVLRILEEKRRALVAEGHGNNRAEPRMILPGATVSFLLRGRGIRNAGFSNSCPLFDLSRGGMAFLSDRPSRPGRKVSLLLNCTEIKEKLRLEGYIVYAVATDMAGYQFRVGVRFMPFEAKRGCNAPEALHILAQLEKTATSL